MKHTCVRGAAVCLIGIAVIIASPGLRAQDPAKVDSTHNKVVLENEQVRVVRSTYPPHEKAAMHSHPNYVAVCITDGTLRITLPDGETAIHRFKAGQAVWAPATTHSVENIGEKPVELVHVELKCPGKDR